MRGNKAVGRAMNSNGHGSKESLPAKLCKALYALKELTRAGSILTQRLRRKPHVLVQQ